MKYALLLLLLAPLVAAADCSTNWMQCSADSPLQISSFTMRATETIGAITAARTRATQNLTAHAITATQAKAVLVDTDTGRALWNKARAACSADAAGNCLSPEKTRAAFALLAQAQQTVLMAHKAMKQ